MQLDNLSDNSDVDRCGFNCSILMLENQAAELEDQLLLWKGNEIQTDDICVMGIRL